MSKLGDAPGIIIATSNIGSSLNAPVRKYLILYLSHKKQNWRFISTRAILYMSPPKPSLTA